MNLAGEIAASENILYKKASSSICMVQRVMMLLPEVDVSALNVLMLDQRVHGTSITEMLNQWAPKVADGASKIKDPGDRHRAETLAHLCERITRDSVQRHRNGRCKCSKDS